MKRLAHFFVSFVFLLCASCFLNAQTNEWQVFSPKDGLFSVEIPKLPVKVITPNDPDVKDSLLEKGLTTWLIPVPGQDEARYSIFRFEFDEIKREFKKEGISERRLIEYLATMIAGDDDAPEFLSRGKPVWNHWVLGTEYTFAYDDQANSALALHTRSRFFVKGKYLFVAKFQGDDARDLSSTDAKRFLRSFKILSSARE